jgi:hypothetical protein
MHELRFVTGKENSQRGGVLRAGIQICNPVYARRVDPSALAFSLSSHRHSYMSLLFSSRFID